MMIYAVQHGHRSQCRKWDCAIAFAESGACICSSGQAPCSAREGLNCFLWPVPSFAPFLRQLWL